MKHLKKYENKTDWSESEFNVIKDILLEIKDSYPTIDGEILRYDEKAYLCLGTTSSFSLTAAVFIDTLPPLR